ncbi:hypothetical protein LCGC14_0850550 [marine sediment metagenome]|uniref:Uncharacterized protein n=1 Tax=marine sediment metagenome TaxID=412755 RepID=A0A0F9PVR8_9ZZZZ
MTNLMYKRIADGTVARRTHEVMQQQLCREAEIKCWRAWFVHRRPMKLILDGIYFGATHKTVRVVGPSLARSRGMRHGLVISFGS